MWALNFFCVFVSLNIITYGKNLEKNLLSHESAVSLNKEENDDSVVWTTYGRIQGQIFPGVRMFRSIPYAKPPIGDLRWSDPEQGLPWGNNTLDATHDPVGCPQSCSLPPLTCPYTQSEDCLFLNVFTPYPFNPSIQYPVLFFVHGGNFKQGYGGGLLYNGTDFVNYTGSIVVTINYRLGALGFLWSTVGPKGNYGFLDQQLALNWVADNIVYFGGNPDKITLFGQSAGAVSVALHMVHESSIGLFNTAILESEPFGLPIRDTSTWGTLPETFFNFLECNYSVYNHNENDFWTCLRNKSIDDIIIAQVLAENSPTDELGHVLDVFMPWTPTCGTDEFSEQVFWLFQQGQYRDVPYIIGTVMNEGVEFVYGAFPDGLSREKLQVILPILVGPQNAIAIENEYPIPNNTSDYRDYLSLLATDGLFKCPTRNVSAVHYNSPQFENDIYMYHFDHITSCNQVIWGPNYTECVDVVCHGAELLYVWHPNLAPVNSSYLPYEDILALSIQNYWSTFTNNLIPNNNQGVNPVAWEPYQIQTEPSITFNQNNIQMDYQVDAQNSNCQFWDSLSYSWIK